MRAARCGIFGTARPQRLRGRDASLASAQHGRGPENLWLTRQRACAPRLRLSACRRGSAAVHPPRAVGPSCVTENMSGCFFCARHIPRPPMDGPERSRRPEECIPSNAYDTSLSVCCCPRDTVRPPRPRDLHVCMWSPRTARAAQHPSTALPLRVHGIPPPGHSARTAHCAAMRGR